VTQTRLSGQLIRSSSVSASAIVGTVPSASFATTASFALNAGGSGFPFSGSAVITGSLNVTEGITGSLFGTASWATNAISSSFAPTILPAGVVSSSNQVSYTELSNIPTGIVSSSGQVATLLPAGTVSSSTQVDFTTISNKPTLISASSQVSYTGLSNIPANIVSSSTQVTSLLPTGTVSSSGQVSYTGLSNIPAGIVSASSQVSYTGLSNIPAGIVSSSGQVATLLPAGTVSSSGQVSYTGLSNIPSGIVSASSQVNYTQLSNIPTGIVSASSQVNYTQLSNIPAGILSSSTQINNLSGVSASFATTASFLLGSVTSASYAETAATASSFSGSLQVVGLAEFGEGLIVSGGLDVNGGITGSLQTDRYSLGLTSLGNASGSMSIDLSTANYFTATTTAATNWSITNTPSNRAVGFVLALTSGGAETQTWPSEVKWPNATAPTLTAAGQDTLTFITDNGGTTWRGVLSIKDSR